MTDTRETQGTPEILRWADGWLVACRAKRLSSETTAFYSKRIRAFAAFAVARGAATVAAITPTIIRAWLLELEAAGHNPGGVHGHFRALRTFLRWYADEAAPDNWRSPLDKVKAPRVPEKILDPVPLADVGALLAACGADTLGLRDRALLLTLLDTGCRAGELTAFDLSDLDQVSGALAIRHGKGDKPRVVFLGRRARKAARAYLRARGDEPGPLFLARSGGRLSYFGLRSIITRLSAAAGVQPAPSLHAFRRAFALEALRAGADTVSLQRLLGHSDLSVIHRYLKQMPDDLRRVHAAVSPVDKMRE